jgi:hypothetical protein
MDQVVGQALSLVDALTGARKPSEKAA